MLSSVFNLPAGLLYLPLGEECLPLLKRGVVPLAPAAASLVWWQVQAQRQHKAVARVDEQEYQAHLEREYQRLPANLQGLLTLAQFVEQAEKKRPEIEAALLTLKSEQAVQVQGKVDDWLMQRFYTDPYSALLWQHTGWQSIWLGIEPQHWPQAVIKPVQYCSTMPAQFPARLLADASANMPLAEQRMVLPVEQLKQVAIGGLRQGLLRLPSSALRCVLLGATVRLEFERQFMAYWHQDLRYKRIPVARMMLQSEQFQWEFQLCQN